VSGTHKQTSVVIQTSKLVTVLLDYCRVQCMATSQAALVLDFFFFIGISKKSFKPWIKLTS